MAAFAQRRLVGIGDAMLVERGGQVAAGGLAVDVAVYAHRMGHIGIPISRLGQDDRSEQILAFLRELDIDTAHLQSDPDLPTGRLIVRSIAGREQRRLDPRSAFDNMQWDFDLVDVAHESDAVAFGMLAQRGGLSNSVIRRFLSECTGALRLFDLTNRADDEFDRTQAQRSMELADIVIVDQSSVTSLLRRSSPADLSSRETVQQVLQIADAAMLVAVQPDAPLLMHSSELSAATETNWRADLHTAGIVTLMHSQLRSDDLAAAAERIDRVWQHIANQPDADIPETLLQ